MFTGLIENLGRVESFRSVVGGARLLLKPDRPLDDLTVGESIAVNGACLTAEPDSTPNAVGFFLSAETLAKTTLGELNPGDHVNLERALQAGDRLGGHLVTGHVDAVGRIERLDRTGEGWDLEVHCPAELRPYLAPKGSVTVDGISLTTVNVTPTSFTVALIPHTVEQTNLREKGRGAAVNLEVDLIARYVVEYLKNAASGGGLTRDFLKQAGFEG